MTTLPINPVDTLLLKNKFRGKLGVAIKHHHYNNQGISKAAQQLEAVKTFVQGASFSIEAYNQTMLSSNRPVLTVSGASNRIWAIHNVSRRRAFLQYV